MIQFDYPSGGIGRKERKKYVFSNFRGVDTSCEAINVDPIRAVESTNFVDRNGVLHKRYGWEQIYQFDDEINGFWKLYLAGKEYLICYAGKTFYRLSDNGWIKAYEDEGRLVSRRTACYVRNQNAYFVGCGDLLVFRFDTQRGYYSFFRVVDDAQTFVPTTTAQILPIDWAQEGLHGSYVRDSINLLTGWRKNTLVSKALGENETVAYKLDAIPSGDTIKINFNKESYELTRLSDEVIYPELSDDISGLVIKCRVKELAANDSTELVNPLEGEVNYPDIAYDAISEGGTWSNDWVFQASSGSGDSVGLRWKREPDSVIMPISSSEKKFCVYSLYLLHEGDERIQFPVMRRYYQKAYTWNREVEKSRCTVRYYKSSAETLHITCTRTSDEDINKKMLVHVYIYGPLTLDHTLRDFVIIIPPEGKSASTVVSFSLPVEDIFITKVIVPERYDLCPVSKDEILKTHTIELLEMREVELAVPKNTVLIKKNEEYKKVLNFYGGLYEIKSDSFSAKCDQLGRLIISKWGLEDSNRANVVVQFYTDVKKETWVSACKYSTLYGVSGASDRLFLTNSDDATRGNIIFFSEMDDFTYFPDNFTKVVGGNSNEVQGFIRLSNGSMAALKTLRANEPNVFVFDGEYITGYYDAEETEKYTLPLFSTSGVNTTQAIIAPYACDNLADDSLFLSINGVYALELSRGTDSQRFSKERSLPINNLLKQCNLADLQNACAITFENKYYLAIKHYKKTEDISIFPGKTYYEKNGSVYTVAHSPNADLGMDRYYEQEDSVYVADAHYSFKPIGAMADAPSYEWYPLTNIPIRSWFLIDQKLYFGTTDGRICKFTNDLYYDIEKYYFANDPNSQSAKVYSQSTIKSLAISSSNDDIDTLSDNDDIDTFSVNKDTVIYDVPTDDYDRDTIVFTSGTLTGVLYEENIDFINRELFIEKLYDNKGEFTGEIRLKYDEDGDFIKFTQADSLVAELRRRRIVKARRELPTFDFGMPDYLKTIESFTVVMNGGSGGPVLVDILTRNNRVKTTTASRQGQYSLLGGFAKNSFNVPFQNSYTKKLAIRNFNYIILKIYNNSPTECSVSSISVIYKYNRVSGGVK